MLKLNPIDDSLKSKSRACLKNVSKELISQTTNWYIDILFFSFLLIISFFVVCVSVCVKGNRVPFFILCNFIFSHCMFLFTVKSFWARNKDCCCCCSWRCWRKMLIHGYQQVEERSGFMLLIVMSKNLRTWSNVHYKNK